MRRPTHTEILYVLLLLLLGLSVHTSFRIRSMGDGVRAIIENAKKPMQTITQKVLRADGSFATVVTIRSERESLQDFQRRHDQVFFHFKGR